MKDCGAGNCKAPASPDAKLHSSPVSAGHNSKSSSPHFCSPRECKRFFLFQCFSFFVLLSILLLYFLYSYSLLLSPAASCDTSSSGADAFLRLLPDNRTAAITNGTAASPSLQVPQSPPVSVEAAAATGLEHVVFGIGASSKLWTQRKEYIKIWWRPRQMRGFVWLDKAVAEMSDPDRNLPVLKISGDTSIFPYTRRKGDRSALRISRIVSETYRLGLPGVRWFVMGDDDTVFLPDNLIGVLSRFDHTQPYYIGSNSESHLQNIYFSYNMAYGGGGFAISFPLAAALSQMQDRCMHRYPSLYGSDDRIQACMAELGVPITRHPGFHQFDVYGDVRGILLSHPVVPLISIHHLDIVQPLFPDVESRADAVRRIFEGPVRLDSAAVMQQSICYESNQQWTVSVAWGFAVTVIRGVMSPREMEMPARTFLNWYPRADYLAYSFNTRPVARNQCQRPYLYFLSYARYVKSRNTTVTKYKLHKEPRPMCRWRIPDPSVFIDRIVIYKKPDPGLWNRGPRRNCCRVLPSPKEEKWRDRTMELEVGVCRDGEVSEISERWG